MAQYRFHSDPSHGWLAVPVAKLVALGIADQISTFSYRRGDMAYLEEDCDAGTFLTAVKASGEDYVVAHLPQANNTSRIRNYYSFYL